MALAGPPAWADTAAGLADFQNGRFAEAFQQWTEAATAGDPRGALFAGVLYDTGLGVQQSYAQALKWYRRAADGGSASGMFNVGIMHDAGRGVPANPAQAASWYERAAAKGFGRAEYNLGLLYEEGIGVTRNRARAVQLFTSAAGHGITAAKAHLQQLGQHPAPAASGKPGDLAMDDFQRAQRLLLRRGPAEAARAAGFFRRAAERGNALAEYDFGYCYEHGLGVPRDPAQAHAWYRRAASHAKDDAVRSIALAGARSLEAQFSLAPSPGADPAR